MPQSQAMLDCSNHDRDRKIAMVRHFTPVRVLILTDMI